MLLTFLYRHDIFTGSQNVINNPEDIGIVLFSMMAFDFVQIWALTLIAIAVTTTVSTIFILTSTGVIRQMSPHERGELRSFSFIVMGIWSLVLSLVLTQGIFLLI